MYNKVKCIINTQNKQITGALQQLEYNIIPVIKSEKVSSPISCHADVLYLKTGEKAAFVSECQRKNIELLKEDGYTINAITALKPGYETESLLNVVICKNTIIYNPKTAFNCDFFNNFKRKITVRQGYTKCSTIVINENAYITEDVGIYKALSANYCDCLLIKKGNVKLDGYNYGFIGGASIMLKNNILFFCGDIIDREEKNKIIAFLKKYNVTPFFIKDMPMTDIGGGIIV